MAIFLKPICPKKKKGIKDLKNKRLWFKGSFVNNVFLFLLNVYYLTAPADCSILLNVRAAQLK